jgi:opacity protein-like surface antigen
MKKLIASAVISLSALSAIFADTIVNEKFSADPLQNGWQIFGDTNLFQWDATNRVLHVTWDSTQPNSYFYKPLGVTLTTNDSFCVQFDLQLSDATASGNGNELAIGLLHYADATSPDFNRANSPLPNLFEFDYFPADDNGDPASESATLKDSQPLYAGFYFASDNLPLNPGMTYRVVLIHRADTEAISGTVYTNGQVMTTLPIIYAGSVGDFQLDTLSISSFADDGFGDSILAHGTVSEIAVASPLPIQAIQNLTPGQIQFASDTNWLYTLEQTADFQMWTPAAPGLLGNGTNLLLQATNPPDDKAFYRVRADLP